MKKKKRWIWLMIIVVVLGAGGYGIYRRFFAPQEAAIAANGTQETMTVTRDTLRVMVDGSGSLAAQREVEIAFETGGKVADVYVEVGDVIKAGDAIANLDDTDARQSVADAELQVRQSEVSLAAAQLTLDDLVTWEPDESEVKLAQANLEAAQADYRQSAAQSSRVSDQLASTRVQLEQAQSALADAQQDYRESWNPERDWELQVAHMKSALENEREAATDALEQARADLEIAQAAYNLEVVGISDSSVKNAHSQVVNAEVALENEVTGPDESEIAAAQIDVEQAEISLEQAKLQLESAQRALEDTILVAPVDGTVTDLDLEIGQMASSGQSVVILSDLTALVVEIGLDESDIAQVSEGQGALVTLDAFDDVELSGTLFHLAPTAQTESGVVLYDVTVILDPTDIPVRAGMTADVEIVTSSAEDVLIIPLKAVRSINGHSFVLRQLKPGEQEAAFSNMTEEEQQQVRDQMTATLAQTQMAGFTMVPVELGIVTDTQVEVMSGLNEGDVISINSTSGAMNAGDTLPPGMGMMVGRGQ
ncbi:MAG: HlyD family efflux transporter periplasmic adaptor subunit [Anaerolineae bacterium]|nr:HlyD family efflux transporter periplasmic adaptor subunit [Anaerolineae bacterium]